MNGYRDAYVYVKRIFAGTLSEIDYGYSFTYDETYLKRENASPISITLPLQKNTYISKNLFPFFDGLIPEGWLLNMVVHNWKINANDRFGLLLVTCKDSIGCVSISSVKV